MNCPYAFMSIMHLKYLGDLQVEAIHELSKVKITTDAPPDNQGKGRSFSPTDLAATSLGACMATIMGIVAKRDNIPLEGMTLQVEKKMTQKLPRRIDELNVTFSIPHLIAEKEQHKLITAAKTCPVHHSLHPDIKINLTFHWKP